MPQHSSLSLLHREPSFLQVVVGGEGGGGVGGSGAGSSGFLKLSGKHVLYPKLKSVIHMFLGLLQQSVSTEHRFPRRAHCCNSREESSFNAALRLNNPTARVKATTDGRKFHLMVQKWPTTYVSSVEFRRPKHKECNKAWVFHPKEGARLLSS